MDLLSLARRWSSAKLLILAVAASAAGIALWYFSTRLPPVPQRTLRIGFESNPPVQIRTENGFSGLAVETVNEAAKRAGIKLEWVETGTSSEQAFKKGLVDLWPLMVDLPYRRRYVHFARPWMHSSNVLLVHYGAPNADRGFKGSIAVFKMPLQVKQAREHFPEAHIVEVPNLEDIVKQACKGADAGFIEARVAMMLLRGTFQECSPTTLRVQGIPGLKFDAGLASTFESAGAADRIQDQIDNMFRNGMLAGLIAKYSYFGLDDTWASYEQMDAEKKWRWFTWTISGLVFALGLMLWQANSLRQRRRAEGVLRDSEERFRLAVQATNDAIWDVDLVTGAVSWNEAYTTLLGRPPEGSKSWQWWIDRIHPDDRERASGGFSSAVNGSESTWTCEYRFQRLNGGWAYVNDRAYIARDLSGSARRVIGAMQDLTERKRAEAELRESEDRFRNIADSAPVIVWLCDQDGTVTFTNRFGLNYFGRTTEQVRGTGWTDLLHLDDSERVVSEFSSATASHHVYQISYRLRRADGEYRWMLAKGAPRFAGDIYIGHIGIAIDITELKQGHEQLQAAQKLESLGVLAGGIAHDFNNLLGGILAEAELVEMDLPEGSDSRGEIQRIKTAAIRGSEIVHELMIYAGESQQNLHETVDLSRLVEEMLKLLKVSISKQVILKTDFPGDLPTVWGNAPHIRQVMMNLVLNASEAIGDAEGVITVAAAQVKGDRDLAPNNAADLNPGDYVRLEVSDTGCGMTDETKAKIFDPFFSTKFPGRGLGLAVVQGIVRDLGGAINIVSAPGQGTVFQVLLPSASAPKGASEIRGTIRLGGLEKSNVQVGTILVVEDEATLRRAVSIGLRHRGFSVIEAGDGSLALDLIHTHKDEIDAILLDVTLPGASSREVLEEALRIRPDLNVIVTSAYDEQMVNAYYSGLRVHHFVRKPFHLDDIVYLCGTALCARAG